MPGSARITLVLTGALLAAGCHSHEDVHARYSLERLSWRAQVQERKINIAFIKASQRDLALAIELLNDVVAYDPLSEYDTGAWDPKVVDDIRRIRLTSRIALANLYFLSEQYQQAGNFYARTLKDATIDFKRELDVRLNLVRTVYLTGETDLLEEQCAAIFDEIDQSDDFWAGKFALQDVFLGIPLVLTRLYADREETDRYREFCATAERFYTRVASTWPNDEIAAKAVYSRVMLFMQQEKWDSALSDIELLMGNAHFEGQRGQLLLLKGEILAYAKEDIPAGVAVFNKILNRYSGTPAGYAAQFDLASIKLQAGNERDGFEMLRELESGRNVPSEVAAKAMLTRALYLEKNHRWDEALPLFRRLVRLFPNSESAVGAPLVVTRHYLDTGELQLAKRNLDRATDYYASLLERQSKYQGDRLLVEDFLIENYLAMDRGKEVAELLVERSRNWDEISSAGAFLKSAVIYSAVLEDDENAARVLKKSIQLFPQTRYAKIAQQQLDQISNDADKK